MSQRDGMRIKSYFAKSVDDAMAQAREQLGDDAMLLNTRRLVSEAGLAGGYEVVFGIAEAAAEPAAPEPDLAAARLAERGIVRPKIVRSERAAAQAAASSPARAPKDHVAAELERLHEQMDEIRGMIARSSRAPLTLGRTVPELADVYAKLMSSEVEPALSRDIVDRLEASMATDAFFQPAGTGRESAANRWKTLRFDPSRLEAFVRVELERRVSVDPRLGTDQSDGMVVALVGPTGAGKTTTLAKLAASVRVREAGRPIRLLSLDTSRAAGYLQLQSATKTLAATFSKVSSVYALPEIVAEARKNDTVLIDTPGYAASDAGTAEATANVLAECGGVDVHLVVPGYMKAGDLRRCIQRYEIFQPTRLLVTKLDETQTLGTVFSEAARAGLRLSFLTHGPAIPGDIRAASVEDFLAMALERQKARAQCVA